MERESTNLNDDDVGKGGVFSTLGAVNTRGKPFVQTFVDGKPFGQLEIPEAMAQGIQMIAAAIEAERDAAFYVWAMEEAKFEPDIAGVMLVQIREYRQNFDLGSLVEAVRRRDDWQAQS